MTANGFSSRRLRCRSRVDGRRLRGVDREVIAAQPLHGHDEPFPRTSSAARGDGVRRIYPVSRRPLPQADLRPADRAGVGLGVEAAVERVVVLGLARRRTW